MSLGYSLSFLAMSLVLFRAVRAVKTSVFEDAFYMLTAFSLCKGTAALVDLRLTGLLTGQAWLSETAASLSGMFSVMANVFLFQAALDFLLYKLPTKVRFRVVPVLIFSGYLLLRISGIIEVPELDRISRLGFGYNSALLTGIAMFNLYYITGRKTSGLLLSGAGFILYSIFEGIFSGSAVWGIDIGVIRLGCALSLTVASFFIRSLLDVEKRQKVAYI
ncbi:MAG: hypothetical protein Q8J64_05175 [Thermodesulfovibrionales bacterium]|nr:hypothetical protein [Thermodesulfovibrionales bacterium]